MSKFNFDRVIANLDRVKKELPPVLANQAQNFFVASFDKQGFTDGSLKGWEPRKNNSREGRAILVKSGRLKRAVGASVKEATWDKVRLEIDPNIVPYAERHNEGLDGMPKREFMGDSATLRGMQIKKINENVDKIWRV